VAQISSEKLKTRPNLSILSLISFIIAFTIARLFSSLNPKTTLQIRGIHIHHFWFGLAMLAIGGWLGITVENKRVNRIAAILFGAGGGLVGDQVGILLTLSAHAYWADFTYTFVIMFLTLAVMVILLIRYGKMIHMEFTELLRSNAGLYFGVFLEVISIAVFLETDYTAAMIVSGFLAIVAFAIIMAYLIQQFRKRL
jgi:hypothetical protein